MSAAINFSESIDPLEIQPLRRREEPPEEFPLDALGGKLGAAVKEVQAAVKAPLALVAQSFLAGAAVAVQGVANIELHGKATPLSAFFLSIAESGERKSAVDGIAKAPHLLWQREAFNQYETDQKAYKNEEAIYTKEKQAVLGGGGKAKQLEELQEPTAPRKPLLFCEDPTFEGIYRLLAEGMPSIGLFSDEGGRMLGGHAMTPENRLKTVASLSKLWDGAAIDRVRSGDGCSILYDRRCSVHLMAQPMAADTFLNDGVSADQGVLGRFLIAKPESTKGTRLYANIDLGKSASLAAYNATITRLLMGLRFDHQTGELSLTTLKITPEAFNLWTGYHDHVEVQQTLDGAYRPISSLASKAAEHAARLAGILQIFDDPAAVAVDADHIKSGIKLMDFYLSEALRLKATASVGREVVEAEKLLKWFKEENLKQIYATKVYQYAPNGLRTKAQAMPILRLLENHGYLLPIDNEVIDGKPRRQAWKITAYSPE